MNEFGLVLAQQRRRRGWSQLQLAQNASLSQKHVSFLETGRSAPGKAALNRLLAALARDGYEADALLTAAGLRSEASPAEWQDAALGPAREVVRRTLDHSLPWPAYALQPDGHVLATNAAIDALLRLAEPADDLWTRAGPFGPNIFDLTLHPDGISAHLLNPEEVVPAVMLRLRRAAHQYASARKTLQRVTRYPLVRRMQHRQTDIPAAPIIRERYRLGPADIAFTAMATHFGSNESEAMAGITIETLVPADMATEDVLASLSVKPAHPRGSATDRS